ncbi:hypothetical protein G5A65_10195 [[Clostridium] scindens]|nr:hypothetical protein [[Clostridium] scindens]
MPYELFWHLNPRKLEPFKYAYQKKMEQEDYNAWVLGQYTRLAIASCFSGKKSKYPDEPFSMDKQQENALSGEEQFLLWIDAYNRKSERKNTSLDMVEMPMLEQN